MSAHTPGPWRVDAHRQVVTVDYSERTGMSKLIAPTHDGMPRAEQEANARLIAAAPDMLALLKLFVADCEAGHEFAFDSLAAAREVIAKAEAA